jgi:hypothetical protein
MSIKWLWMLLALSLMACAQKTPRCDGPLRPINVPSLPDMVKTP